MVSVQLRHDHVAEQAELRPSANPIVRLANYRILNRLEARLPRNAETQPPDGDEKGRDKGKGVENRGCHGISHFPVGSGPASSHVGEIRSHGHMHTCATGS